MFFWNSCFCDDPADVGSLISGSSAFFETSLNIWKFTVHVLLKPGLENFEHYFTSMWGECNCVVGQRSLRQIQFPKTCITTVVNLGNKWPLASTAVYGFLFFFKNFKARENALILLPHADTHTHTHHIHTHSSHFVQSMVYSSTSLQCRGLTHIQGVFFCASS